MRYGRGPQFPGATSPLTRHERTHDVTGSRPGMMDFKGRAKFDAWSKRKGTTKDAAMEAYVALVDRLVSR